MMSCFLSCLSALCLLLCLGFVLCHPRSHYPLDEYDKLLNRCLSGHHHKPHPTTNQEELHEQCHAWSPLSCCYRNVSEALHNDYSPLYGFTLDHCYREKRVKMSQECRDYFLRDHCFYECEPNLGPWVVPDPKKKWRKERIHSVPLCASECNDWFNACRNDFTCTDNWSTKFKWRRGTNHCPGICETFDHIFNGSAKTFCETVFDGDFVFTPDSSPCMRFRFDPDLPNPNAAVAEWKVHELKAAKATLVVENGIVKSGGDQRHVYSTGNSAEMSVASRPLALLLLLVCYVASN